MPITFSNSMKRQIFIICIFVSFFRSDDIFSLLQDSQGYDNGRDLNDDDYEARKVLRLRSILGEHKVHYGSLIEQLIFMEETHRP